MPRVKDLQRYRKIYSYYRPKPVEEALATGGVDETVIQGLDWKQSVIAASTSNIIDPLPSEGSPYSVGSPVVFTLDGVTLEQEDRVLVKDQTTSAQNGIYLYYSSSAAGTYWFTRALDAEQDTLTAAAAVFVEQGTNNADSAFVLTTNDPITVGTTAQTWVKFAGAGSSIFNSSGSYAKTVYNVSFDSSNRYNDAIGSDVFFFVSGSVAVPSGANRKVAVFGGDLFVSGNVTHGTGSTASGLGSHAGGYSSVASGQYSHAEGSSTTAAGNYSHAEGVGTTASAAGSHAEGYNASTVGLYSHAEGHNTTATGDYSHAAGYGTDAIGNYSYAGGNETKAEGAYQHVVGQFNLEGNSDSLFVVGDGPNRFSRNDVFRVNVGTAQVTGSLVATLGLSGSLTKLSDGTSYLVAGTNVTITSASNGQVVISSAGGGGGGGGPSYFDSTTAGSIFTTGSAAFVGGSTSIDSPSDVGTDVFFYVSGTVGSAVVAPAVSLFQGDVITSGSMLMNVTNGVAGPTYTVTLSDHLVVFAGNNVTASLPLDASVGFNVVFKDGTGAASTSPQMLSCPSGVIDGAATYTLPAVNYSAVTVVKVSQPDTWVVI